MILTNLGYSPGNTHIFHFTIFFHIFMKVSAVWNPRKKPKKRPSLWTNTIHPCVAVTRCRCKDFRPGTTLRKAWWNYCQIGGVKRWLLDFFSCCCCRCCCCCCCGCCCCCCRCCCRRCRCRCRCRCCCCCCRRFFFSFRTNLKFQCFFVKINSSVVSRPTFPFFPPKMFPPSNGQKSFLSNGHHTAPELRWVESSGYWQSTPSRFGSCLAVVWNLSKSRKSPSPRHRDFWGPGFWLGY